mmetsp:Transcript_33332/g.66183  ORF Transcript_33332/g.66183 Transcript_33332/m.66183 type:complete len:140 (-) Transcript_33332:7-426(-)
MSDCLPTTRCQVHIFHSQTSNILAFLTMSNSELTQLFCQSIVFFLSIPGVPVLVLAFDFASFGPFGQDASVEAEEVVGVVLVVVVLVASSSSSYAVVVAAAAVEVEEVAVVASVVPLWAMLMMVLVSCGSPALQLDWWP